MCVKLIIYIYMVWRRRDMRQVKCGFRMPVYVNHFALVLRNKRKTRKLCYRKDDRAMPLCDLYMDAMKFSGLPDYAHRYYSQHFSWAFVPIEAMNVRTNFEVRNFTRS